MTFENILEVYSEKLTEKHLCTVGKIKNIVEKLGKKCSAVKATELQKSCFQNIDLIVTTGGDGTVIRAAHYLKDVPLLGINSEPEISEGGLTSLDETEFGILEEILQGNYRIVQRQRATAKRNGLVIEESALNEVYVGAYARFDTSRYTIILPNNQKEFQKTSGVIVATGSGSNAWYKSAGGEPFHYSERKLGFVVTEPFKGRIFKLTIPSGEIKEGEKLEFIADRYDGGIVSIDSQKIYDFNVPDVVEVCLSDIPLNVIVKNG